MASILLKKNISISVAIIIVSLIIGCSKDHIDYNVKVQFVDSTFLFNKENYNSGEIVYILATERVVAAMSETVTVTIESSLGDVETVECWPRGLITIDIIHHHGGSILSRGASSFIHNNGILEVISTNDLIQASYEVKNQTAVDTAYVITQQY